MEILFNNKLIKGNDLKIELFHGFSKSYSMNLWYHNEFDRRGFHNAVDIIDNYRELKQYVDLNEGTSAEKPFYIKLKSEGVLSFILTVRLINDHVLSENNVSSTLYYWKNLALIKIEKNYVFQPISIEDCINKYLKPQTDYKLMSWVDYCEISNQSSYLNHHIQYVNQYKEDITVSLGYSHLILLKKGYKRWDYNNSIEFCYHKPFRFVSIDDLLSIEMSKYSLKQMFKCSNLYFDSIYREDIPINKQVNSYCQITGDFNFQLVGEDRTKSSTHSIYLFNICLNIYAKTLKLGCPSNPIAYWFDQSSIEDDRIL